MDTHELVVDGPFDEVEQGNGYATATAELLVQYALEERRLNKVVARVLAFDRCLPVRAGDRRVRTRRPLP